MANQISQIKVGSTTYDINAKTLDGKTWGDIVNEVDTAQFVVSTSVATTPNITKYNNGSTETQGTLTPANADANNIYLVAVYEGGVFKYYNEYIVIENKTKWVLLGTTDMNLAGYAKDGVYETAGATSTTNEYSGETVTSGETSLNNIGGDAAMKYYKATKTGDPSKVSETKNVQTVTPTVKTKTFTGTAATIPVTGTIEAHTHTITPTTGKVNNVTAVTVTGNGSHSHDIEGLHTHTSKTVLTKAEGKTTTINSVTGASTKSDGVHSHKLSGAPSTIASVSGEVLTLTAQALTSVPTVEDSVGHTHTVTVNSTGVNAVTSIETDTASVADLGTTATFTSKAATHSHGATITSTEKEFMTGGTLDSKTPKITIESISYTPKGTINVELNSHTHTYSAPVTHTHDVNSVEETASGSVLVSIAAHSHSVTIPKHSHNVNSHTHNVTIS